jgi:hypothetical protein
MSINNNEKTKPTKNEEKMNKSEVVGRICIEGK